MLASIGTRRPESPDELISPQLAAALDQLDIASARTFLGRLQGERRSKSRGRSVEFEDYRQYALWKLTPEHVTWYYGLQDFARRRSRAFMDVGVPSGFRALRSNEIRRLPAVSMIAS